MVENLLQLCIDSHLRFYRVLTGTIKRAGVFEISVQFDDNGCVFHPTSKELQQILRITTKNIIDTVDSIPRVLYVVHFVNPISFFFLSFFLSLTETHTPLHTHTHTHTHDTDTHNPLKDISLKMCPKTHSK
jgi:hypothetical protein